jgi:hypothetical protein
MPRSAKVVSLVGLALATAFYGFFMFTKHDPALSAVIPFASDPYDSVGSFGLIASALLAMLALYRSFRPYRSGPPSPRQKAFLARTHAAVGLGVLVSLAADTIAMARHTSMWTGTAVTGELLALLVGAAAVALIYVLGVSRAARGIDLPTVPGPWRRAAIVAMACVVVLALYPENVINSVPGELFSLAVGILILFMPVSALLVAVVPYDTGEAESAAGGSGRLSRRWVQWGVVTLLGIAIGVVSLLGEASGEGGIPVARLLMVGAVFIGAGTTGSLVAYYSLRRPLGLFQR